MDDTDVVDAIATYLGTQAEWSGADALEVIADLVGTVRPHPGDVPYDEYLAELTKVTGRPVLANFDMSRED